jgi:ankyrin repeat protein
VSFLIERGAHVAVVDALGKSPLDAAMSRVGGRAAPNAELVAELLRNASASAPN